MFKKFRSFFFENKTARQTIVKNAFWLLSGNILSRFIRAGIIIYAARVLGATQWGVFNYALSLAAFFTIFIDFGINGVITRESSKDPKTQEKYFSTAFLIKAASFTVVTLGVITLYPFLGKFLNAKTEDTALVASLIPFMLFIVGFDSFRDFGSALCRAWEKMEIEATIQVITNIIVVVVGFIAISYIPSARSLAFGYIAGTFIGALVAFYPFRHYFRNFFTYFSFKTARKILMASWPLGIMGLIGAIMLNTDAIMIGWFTNLEDVGYYSAGQRIAQLIYILPGIIISAFFPSLAKAAQNKEQFSYIMEKATAILSLIAFPLTIGGVILSKEIILLLYGNQYLPGATAFLIMNLTYIPVFASSILGNAIFAINQEKKLFTYVLISAVGNFLFNLLLIPQFNIAGAALSTLINLIISVSYLTIILKKNIEFSLVKSFKKALLASLAMGVVAGILLLINANIYIILLISIIAYYLALLKAKEETFLEINKMLFKKRRS